MILTEKDAQQFIRLHKSLVFFAYMKMMKREIRNTRGKARSWNCVPEDELEDYENNIMEAREYLYTTPGIFDWFIEANPFQYSREELEIIRSWNHFVKGEFWVSRHLKKNTIFLSVEDNPVAYGIIGIVDELKDMMGSRTPLLVEAVLLPFKDNIIHDGLIFMRNIYFGGGIQKSVNSSYMMAKAKYGIITSLPFEENDEEDEEKKDVELLKFYLKSQRNREYYDEEIQDLMQKNPGLLEIFHQEMGRIISRKYKKELREIGFTDVWFAVLKGFIVGSGKTRDGLLMNLRPILPHEESKFIYIFHLK